MLSPDSTKGLMLDVPASRLSSTEDRRASTAITLMEVELEDMKRKHRELEQKYEELRLVKKPPKAPMVNLKGLTDHCQHLESSISLLKTELYQLKEENKVRS